MSSIACQVETPPVMSSSPEEEFTEEDELSPVEQVRLTVLNSDDPSVPVWTFRMWTLGLFSCTVLSFINQFFAYRNEPLVVTATAVLVATFPIGRLMAAVLPERKFKIPGLGSREFSLNPGPFNMKEHVLISVMSNAGTGPAYAIHIVNMIKAFYGRSIPFLTAWVLVITTQVLGYGWAGLLRKYVVEPGHMWWPSTLAQISLLRTLHEKEREESTRSISRMKFFVIALTCSFLWYLFPGYLFQTLQSISWICWVFPKSVTAHQLGSGLRGLGLGSFTLDWSTVSSFLSSPLITPFFAIVNVCIGYIVIVYVITPISYWGLNLYGAKTFPILYSRLFTSRGQFYDVSSIVNDKFELDKAQYAKQGSIHFSTFFVVTYGLGFATAASIVSHCCLFYGREIISRYRPSRKEKQDVHTRVMRKNYKDVPAWWFYILLSVTLTISVTVCLSNTGVQLQWWGLILAALIAFTFTLPLSIITATTNQTPKLNIITEYLMGLLYPGRPIANVCFKVYGYISMVQAISFLADFKLGHYMKIPPRSMFLVQIMGTFLSGTMNMGVAWWLLSSVPNICQTDQLPANSPWRCPRDNTFFNGSVVFGLVGPKRIFGPHGNYTALNWFFLGGLVGPVIVWLFHRRFPRCSWIHLVNLPVLLGATAAMPPATPINFNSWILVGTVFNFFVYRYRRKWWKRYNYVLSAALDVGLVFMAVVIHAVVVGLGKRGKTLHWWGADHFGPEHCDLATCPTTKGVRVDHCPLLD